MAQDVTTISALFSTPYLTIAEYKQAPTAVDVDDLVGGGNSAINDQELANCIARASSWMDAHCGQVLGATLDTESFRARVSRDGYLKVHPRYFPVISVVSALYGSNPLYQQALDANTAWIEQMAVVFPLGATSFIGPIQFTPTYASGVDQYVTITYVNGYANTLLSSSVLAGATSIPVSDLTGFVPGQQFQIYDGSVTELCRVSSSFTATQGAGSLPLASALAHPHDSGISVSALPPAIKQAAIYMTNVVLKSRGNASLVMGQINGFTPGSLNTDNPAVASDYNSAVDLLKPFRRIR